MEGRTGSSRCPARHPRDTPRPNRRRSRTQGRALRARSIAPGDDVAPTPIRRRSAPALPMLPDAHPRTAARPTLTRQAPCTPIMLRGAKGEPRLTPAYPAPPPRITRPGGRARRLLARTCRYDSSPARRRPGDRTPSARSGRRSGRSDSASSRFEHDPPAGLARRVEGAQADAALDHQSRGAFVAARRGVLARRAGVRHTDNRDGFSSTPQR